MCFLKVSAHTGAEAEVPIRWQLDAKASSLGKILMLGKIEGKRRWQQRMIWLYGITGHEFEQT